MPSIQRQKNYEHLFQYVQAHVVHPCECLHALGRALNDAGLEGDNRKACAAAKINTKSTPTRRMPIIIMTTRCRMACFRVWLVMDSVRMHELGSRKASKKASSQARFNNQVESRAGNALAALLSLRFQPFRTGPSM